MTTENENTDLDGQEQEELEKDDVIILDSEIDEDDESNLDDDSSGKSGESTSEGEAEVEGEEKVDKHINQDAVNKKINDNIREKKEALEKFEREQSKRLELEEKLAKLTSVELPPIPEIPDYMDADYEEKMSARDEIVKRHATDAANKEALQKVKNDQLAAEQVKRQEEHRATVRAFDDRTTELKLDKKTLEESQNTVGSFLTGKSELCRYLLSDTENGPLNVLYLSQNIAECEKISKMPETQAAVYVATKIAPEAQKLKPKQTKTPDPPYSPSGRSKTESEDPNLQGVTFT